MKTIKKAVILAILVLTLVGQNAYGFVVYSKDLQSNVEFLMIENERMSAIIVDITNENNDLLDRVEKLENKVSVLEVFTQKLEGYVQEVQKVAVNVLQFVILKLK
jgi:hypothetical protein